MKQSRSTARWLAGLVAAFGLMGPAHADSARGADGPRKEAQARAVASIEKVGGEVERDEEKPRPTPGAGNSTSRSGA